MLSVHLTGLKRNGGEASNVGCANVSLRFKCDGTVLLVIGKAAVPLRTFLWNGRGPSAI